MLLRVTFAYLQRNQAGRTDNLWTTVALAHLDIGTIDQQIGHEIFAGHGRENVHILQARHHGVPQTNSAQFLVQIHGIYDDFLPK
jgi:hypothetical protein